MTQTRMFRDRVVSMEQTFEGGEKHLSLLKEICREAFPEFELREHAFDHERDLFVMELEGSNGQRKRVCWTRMVLFDSERIPTLTGDPSSALRGRIVEYLRSRAGRPEIVVTFRHLENGWVDTPEPRRDGRRRRRGGRGRGTPEKRGASAPAARGAPSPERRPPPGPAGAASSRGASPRRPAAASSPPGDSAPAGTPGAGGKRRRRFRRRRRGRGSGGPASPASGAPS